MATVEWPSAARVTVAGAAELPTKEARGPNCSNSAASTEARLAKATIPVTIAAIKLGELNQRIVAAGLATVEAITAVGFAVKAVIK